MVRSLANGTPIPFDFESRFAMGVPARMTGKHISSQVLIDRDGTATARDRYVFLSELGDGQHLDVLRRTQSDLTCI